MADARYVIDLILRARDDTAAAFASALGNQELFNRAQEESATQAEKNAQAFQRSSNDIRRQTKDTASALRDVKAANKEILDQQVVVEQAAKRLARTQADQGLSQRERVKRQIEDNARLKEAQEDLFELLKANAIAEKQDANDFDGLAKQREAAQQRQVAAETELTRLTEEKIRKGRAAQRNERDKADAEIADLDRRIEAISKLDRSETARLASSARSVATERLKVEQLREQERVIKQLEATSKKFVDTQDIEKARQFGREIDQQAQALLRLGRSQKEIDTLTLGIKTERTDEQFGREHQRIARETADATIDLQKTVDAEVEASVKARDAELRRLDQEEIKDRAARRAEDIAIQKADAQALADFQKTVDAELERSRKQVEAALTKADREEAQERATRVRRELALQRAEIAAAQQQASARRALTSATKDYIREIDRAATAQVNYDRARDIGAVSSLPQLQKELALRKEAASLAGQTLERKVKEEITVGVDLDTGEALTAAAAFEIIKKQLGRDIHINVDADVGGAAASLAALQALKGGAGAVEHSFKTAGTSIAGVGATLRGFATIGVILFLNQIATGAIAAGGALVALAGSAFYAGGALAGGLAAGAAQALPVLGLLGVAAQRFSKIIEAVKQSQLVEQQQSGNAEKIAKTQADAVDRVRRADEQLGEAQRRLRTAQEGITGARKDAVRALQDLILAEREAALAAKGAVLSQKEAQDALQKAVQGGDLNAVRRAQLNVEAAPTATARANLGASRAQQDLIERAKTEPPEIKQAKENIRTARAAVASAQAASVAARRALQVTGDESLAAAGKLDFLLSKMSASERRLYQQVQRLFGVFDTEAIKQLTDPIIGSFATVLDKAFGAFDNQAFIGKLVGLSNEIGFQINRIFERLTSDENIEKFFGFIDDATKNLGPFVDIILNLADAFLGIATAASPIFALMLQDLAGLTKRFAEFVNSAEGKNELAKFFTEGYKQLKSFLALLGALGQLFLSVVNPDVGGGATAGRNILDGLTSSIRKLNEIANSEGGRKKLQDFFRRTVEVVKALKPIVIALGGAIEQLFSDRSIAAFKQGIQIFTEVLLPALLDIMRAVGGLTTAVGILLDIPLVGFFLRAALAITALKAGSGLLLGIFFGLARNVRLATAAMFRLAVALPVVRRLLYGLIAPSVAAQAAFASFRASVATNLLIISSFLRRYITRFFVAGRALGLALARGFAASRFGMFMINALITVFARFIPLSVVWGTSAGTAFGAAMAIAIPLAVAAAGAAIGYAIGAIIRKYIPGVSEIADLIGEKIGGGDKKNKEQNEGAREDAVQQSTWDRQMRLARTPEFFMEVVNKKKAEAGQPLVRWSREEANRRRVAYQKSVGVSTRKPGDAGPRMPEMPDTPETPEMPKISIPKMPGVNIPDVKIPGVDAGGLNVSGQVAVVTNKLVLALDELTKDGGTLDQIRKGIEDFVTNRQLKTKLRMFKMRRGEVTGGGIEEQLDALSENIRTQNLGLKRYRAELTVINSALRRARRGLRSARTEEERQQFEGQINLLQTALTDTQTKIADTMEQIVADKIDLLQRRLDQSLEAARGRGLSGPQIESGRKIADALGLTGFGAALSDASIELLKAQAIILKRAIRDAKRKGLGDKAKELQNQLDSLRADIFVAVAEQLNTAIEAVNNAASRRGAILSLFNRISEMREKTGDRQGAADSRVTNQRGTTASLNAQRSALIPLLDRARQQGNQKAVEDLTAQIQELTVGIAESVLTTKDLIDASRQVSIDLIVSTRDFKTGLFGGLKGLVEAANASSGGTSPELQESILQATGSALREGLSGLQGKLAEFGIDVRGLTGTDLASALNQAQQGGQIGAIQSGLTGQALETFNSLLTGVIDNATALENNTAAINILNSSVVQTFQSSAWNRFRQALFDGSGGLMPSYSVPTFDTGGEVLRAGLARVHPGDIAIKGTRPGQTVSSGWNGDVKIEVNEAGRDTDVNHLASRFAFEMRTMGNRR